MNSRGKKVLDVDWKKDGVEIRVPVKAFERNNFETGVREMYFRAVHEESGLDVDSTDINVVKQKIVEYLNVWYTVDWSLYMLVEVEERHTSHGSTGACVMFSFQFYVVGTDCRGKKRYMNIPRPENVAKFDPKDFTCWGGAKPKDEPPTTGEKTVTRFGGRPATCSLIPATSENVAAADQFVKSMGALIEKMHHHFSPKQIDKMLASPGLLLPAPKK